MFAHIKSCLPSQGKAYEEIANKDKKLIIFNFQFLTLHVLLRGKKEPHKPFFDLWDVFYEFFAFILRYSLINSSISPSITAEIFPSS